MAGTDVVVDVANSPSFEDKAALEFFETSGRNLLKAEEHANVGHHIALSIVDTDRLSKNGYFRAKSAQENLIKSSKVPYTIVRATQFLEFLGSIAQSGTVGQTVYVPTAYLQPIASDDVAIALLHVAENAPINGTIEIASPERIRFSEIVEQYLIAMNDHCKVLADVDALYYGYKLSDNTHIPGKNAHLGTINFMGWFESQNKGIQ